MRIKVGDGDRPQILPFELLIFLKLSPYTLQSYVISITSSVQSEKFQHY